MNNPSTLSDAELLDCTRSHLQRAQALDAELLQLLGEIDARGLYKERAFSSMFAFCVGELSFSEDAAYNRIGVARLARSFPRILDFVRDGRIHLTGLRLLSSHLTAENLEAVLAAAVGKSKRDIEELVARLSPQPAVPPTIRRLPGRPTPVVEKMAPAAVPVVEPSPAPVTRKPEVKPLSAATYKVEFTADSALKAKLQKAEELMRHRVGKGNLAAVIDRALDVLIAEVMKERFGVGRKPRSTAANAEQREVVTRHIPDPIKREVFERDGGQCTFVREDGRRCEERGALEFEHRSGFARTGTHSVAEITLLCRAHNQYAADKMYGREFMQRKRTGTRSGTSSQDTLFDDRGKASVH
jgi:hypothetical protein